MQYGGIFKFIFKKDSEYLFDILKGDFKKTPISEYLYYSYIDTVY
jgi:hypothetical protein